MGSLKSKMVDDVLWAGFSQPKLLDEMVIKEVGDQLLQLITEAAESKKILLTFHGVQFMSSSMLGKLVIFGKKCEAAKVDLKLSSINDNIMEVFKITKMNKTFEIYKDEDAAIKAFSKKGWFG